METIKTDILVIGSGAGGSVTASILAGDGYSVLLVEEGPYYKTGDFLPSTAEMMHSLWRNGGLVPILGKIPVAFAEGRCVGGGTTINSGLYHRTPEQLVKEWKDKYSILDFEPNKLDLIYKQVEKIVSISQGHSDLVGEKMKMGAEKKGWYGSYMPRLVKECVNTNLCAAGCPTGAKQSMLQNFLPKFFNAGGTLLAEYKITKLVKKNRRIVKAVGIKKNTRSPFTIEFDDVFVCGGAIQTPALIRRSGIKQNIGNSLLFHPTIKVAALFDEHINAHEMAMSTYQVKEFAPDISFGASLFSLSTLAVSLMHNSLLLDKRIKDFRNMALYYVSIRGTGKGLVRTFPFLGDGIFATYKLSDLDVKLLSKGLAYLCQLLFEAGAKEVYPYLKGYNSVKSPAKTDIYLKQPIPKEIMNLMSIHAFSSCPMGENTKISATDSYGKVHNFKNLYINDASLIPEAPGVNPQGTVMALAYRNAQKFIRKDN